MRKQIMLKVMATALAAVVAAPIGSLTIHTTRPVIVKAATAKAAKAAAELKTATKVTGVSESEESSWSPATLNLEGISRYDDATKTWLDAITEVKVGDETYVHADDDYLEKSCPPQKLISEFIKIPFTAPRQPSPIHKIPQISGICSRKNEFIPMILFASRYLSTIQLILFTLAFNE